MIICKSSKYVQLALLDKNLCYSLQDLDLRPLAPHIIVIALGALLVMKNQFSVGMLMAFLAYRQSLVNKSSSIIQKIFDYKLISVQLNRVADILLQPIEMNGDIKVKHLSHCYGENE